MSYNPKDHFFRKAKEENFSARSVYKLQEIDKKFRLFSSGQQVLDLGASPGSWTEYVSPILGPKGAVLAIDLNPVVKSLPNVHFVQGDLYEIDIKNLVTEKNLRPEFDIVMSDMAPKTTGIKITDQARSFGLCQLAFDLTADHLKTNGHFVCKFFHSDDFSVLKKLILSRFQKCEVVKPQATRTTSKEIFLVGLKKK